MEKRTGLRTISVFICILSLILISLGQILSTDYSKTTLSKTLKDNYENTLSMEIKIMEQAAIQQDNVEKMLEDKIISLAYGVKPLLTTSYSKLNDIISAYAKDTQVFEINIVKNKTIVSSNMRDNINWVFPPDHAFNEVLSANKKSYAEPCRKSTVGDYDVKYGGVNLNNHYFVQVGVKADAVTEFKKNFGIDTCLQNIAQSNGVISSSIYTKKDYKIVYSSDKSLLNTSAIAPDTMYIDESTDKNSGKPLAILRKEVNLSGEPVIVETAFDLSTYKKNKTAFSAFANIITISVAVLLLCVIIFMDRKLVKPLICANEDILSISKGQFNTNKSDPYAKYNNEIGQMCRGISSLKETLKELIKEINNSVSSLYNSSNILNDITTKSTISMEDISSASQQLAASSTDEAKGVENMVHRLDSLAHSIDNSSECIERLSSIVENSMKNISVGNDTIKTLEDETKNTNINLKNVSSIVDKVGHYAENSESIITLIDTIAKQTNLLALNASIEASHAGESGKGFAVVASEIKKLSEQTASATNNIKDNIKNIQKVSNDAIVSVGNIIASARNQGKYINHTTELFTALIDALKSIASNLVQVKELSSSLSNDKDSILDNISTISAVIEETTASCEEISASMESEVNNIRSIGSLSSSNNDLAKKLDKIIKNFLKESEEI
ncbi:Methyl-accepting chemotaxis protein [Hathewaya proteolytica DSM 3090]|uniref:Methyl-accepting chemotaxis protein n=1 Tax=Hathewaya proteolytica DSM 3090 TaxID=1121331 RepID=A0A1M6QNA5_9CLOT|nr:methyl-accepting chemotaxis protein [Hathewaya proteolytica]SHK21731.1 Methyl-accepting chemotaxis protein [Hathewaya proteolytica DSM 3090]